MAVVDDHHHHHHHHHHRSHSELKLFRFCPFWQSGTNSSSSSSTHNLTNSSHSRSTRHEDGANSKSSSSSSTKTVSSIARSLLPPRRRLRLDPANRLYFPYEPGKQVKSAVRLKTTSRSDVAFKARDLNEYNPSTSRTSKHLSCGHQLCELDSNCKSPKQPCPDTINYYTENTSSSGFLVEDTLHLASGSVETSNASVQAPIIIRCGMKQSGGYLDGVAPDGLMGLGLGENSVPSFLAKAGFVLNSFSMCSDEDDSGRIFFGDHGPATQRSTSFLPLDGKYISYIVGVEACCVGNSCLKQTSFRVLIDSGTSFTFLPDEVYETIAEEFDRRVNATRSSYEGSPWKYCYKSRKYGAQEQ